MKYKNNPFNIRYSKNNNWIGQIEPANGFCQFATLESGVRAFLIILRSYERHGINTIAEFVARYAPNADKGNNEERYCNYLSTRMGYDKDNPSFGTMVLDFHESNQQLIDFCVYVAFIESMYIIKKELISIVLTDLMRR